MDKIIKVITTEDNAVYFDTKKEAQTHILKNKGIGFLRIKKPPYSIKDGN